MSERLTTDNPQNMTDSMLNLAYAEDKWVHIRGMKEPFTDYIKSQCRKQGCDLEEMSDDELAESVMDCGFDHPECPIFLLHTVATQAAELRARLKHFEDLQEQGRLIEPPCRRNDIVYRLCGAKGRKFIGERRVVSVEYNGNTVIVHSTASDILGRTVFLTEAEAKAERDRLEGKR